MSQVSNAVEVTILPPHVPSEEECASPALYAQNVQALFCKALGLSAVDQVRKVPSPISSDSPCTTARSAALTRERVVRPLSKPQDSHLTESNLSTLSASSALAQHYQDTPGWAEKQCALALSSNR